MPICSTEQIGSQILADIDEKWYYISLRREMTNFADYNLGYLGWAHEQGIFGLADELVPEMMEAAGVERDEHASDEAALRALVGALSPNKELVLNINTTMEKLGENAVERAIEWVDRSGVLEPINRSFQRDETPPKKVDSIVFSGGVANWMLRRTALLERLDPASTDRVVIAAGERVMKPGEHQMVKNYAQNNGRLPTEYEFMGKYILPRIGHAGFNDRTIHFVDGRSSNADEIWAEAIRKNSKLVGPTRTLIVTNAPNSIQAAGQFRLSARQVDEGFDGLVSQLFVVSDSIPVARHGEKSPGLQDPVTAIGQIARNALVLHQNLAHVTPEER